LTGISCPLVDTCLAVGGPPNGPGGGTIAEIWDGSTWQLQGTPVLPGAHTLSFPAISCWSSTACMMVGGFENDGPGSITLAEQWDGTLASAATRLASTVRGPQAPDCSRAARLDRRNLLLCGVGDPPALGG
jgi:hypothetical protein